MRTLALLMTTLLLASCQALRQPYSLQSVPDFRPGMPIGYLKREELPNSLTILPPPPVKDSVAMQADLEASNEALKQQDSARFEQATRDAVLQLPAAVQSFACIIGVSISESETPRLTMLMKRTLMDAGLSTYTAKTHYQRPRPFMQNRATTCAPETEAALRANGSYPSGHAAIGFAWGLVLADLDPGHADALIRRGWEFGQSRVFCNVHWQSDVDNGRLMGAITVARLQQNDDFRTDRRLAVEELAHARLQDQPPSACM